MSATEQDFVNELASVKQTVADYQTSVQNAVNALEGIIAALRAQPAQAATAATNWDELVASAEGIRTLLVPLTGADVPKTDVQIPSGETPVSTSGE